jgi:WD40 repeat protein
VTTSSSVYAVKFDEEKVVCGMQDSHIRVYDRKTSKLTLTLSGHRDWVGAVQYDDEKVRAPPTPKSFHPLCLPLNYNDVCLHFVQIVSCSGDMHIRVWNWAGVCTKKLKGHTGWVKRLQVLSPSVPLGIAPTSCIVHPNDTCFCGNSTTTRCWFRARETSQSSCGDGPTRASRPPP